MRREKKGVAGIIAGVMLAAILFSSVAIYFLAITNGQNTRSKAEIQALQFRNEKETESFRIISLDTLKSVTINNINYDYIQIVLNNTGSVPVTAAYLNVYNSTTSVPLASGSLGLTLNGGINAVTDTSSIDPNFSAKAGSTYRIDVISERGNVQSTTWPPPPPISGGSLDQVITPLAENVLAQNTGSIMLNFTAFGVILKDLASKDNVDQTGWLVTVKSVNGYPASRIPSVDNLYLVTRVKNKDVSNLDFNFLHETGLLLTVSSGTSLSQTHAFICGADEANKLVSQYNDSNPIVLQNVRDSKIFGPDAGWKNVFFCDTKLTDQPVTDPCSDNGSTCRTDFKSSTSDISFFTFVMRGEFTNNQQYAQTVPYQAVLVTKTLTGGSPFLVCLQPPAASVACPSSTTSSSTNVLYQGTPNTTVKVRFDSGGISPYRVVWVYPDGAVAPLVSGVTSTTTNITVPSDAEQVCSSLSLPLPCYQIVQVVDRDENVYYMTFKVT